MEIVYALLLSFFVGCSPIHKLNNTVVNTLLSNPDEEFDVLWCDKDWESQFDYATILKVGRKYIMYYRAINFDIYPHQTYCYAISSDGIHWEKPVLNVFEFMGDSNNNIITDRVDGVSVEYHEGNYLMLVDRVFDENNKLHRGLVLYKSQDGIHFVKNLNFKVPYFCDSQNELMWDDTSKTYKLYLRSWYESSNPLIDYHHSHKYYRSVSLLETPTLEYSLPYTDNPLYLTGKTEPPSINEELPVVLKNNSLSDDFDIYGAYVNKYNDSLYIAYPINYYHTDSKKRGGKYNNDGYGTIGFWTSPDGRSFTEVKRDYINIGDKWIESCIGYVETDDKYIHYYIPFNNTHAERPQKNTIKVRVHYKKREKK